MEEAHADVFNAKEHSAKYFQLVPATGSYSVPKGDPKRWLVAKALSSLWFHKRMFTRLL